jgi:hypothetical protein
MQKKGKSVFCSEHHTDSYPSPKKKLKLLSAQNFASSFTTSSVHLNNSQTIYYNLDVQSVEGI